MAPDRRFSVTRYPEHPAFLDRDPLDFIERDFVSAAVIKLGCPRRFVVGDLLRHFQLAAVLQIRRDAGRAKGMIANARFDAGRFRTPANDSVGVLLEEGIGRFSFALAGFVASHHQCGGRHGYISGRYYACAPDVILDHLRDDPGISVGVNRSPGRRNYRRSCWPASLHTTSPRAIRRKSIYHEALHRGTAIEEEFYVTPGQPPG